MEEFLQNFVVVLSVMSVALILAIIPAGDHLHQIRHIKVPPGAGCRNDTLYAAPGGAVSRRARSGAGLSIAPIAWVVLDRLGLKGLRGIATFSRSSPSPRAIQR